jgi:acid phosphatase type 7
VLIVSDITVPRAGGHFALVYCRAFAGMRTSWALAAAAATAAAAAPGASMLTAAPAVLTTATAVVNVTWEGVTQPASTDWVSAYCVGAPESAFGAWFYVTGSPGWATGAGALSFTVTYAGCALEFRYYRDPAPYTLVGTSNAVAWAAPPNNTLRHVHLAYGRVPQTQMHVSWTSDDGVTPAVLQVGHTRSGVYDLGNVTVPPPVTYAEGDLCGPSVTGYAFPGYFFHAFVAGLAPGTRYWVRPVQGGTLGAEVSFVTGKPVGPGVDTRFAVFGDMDVSGGAGAAATAAHVTALAAGGAIDFATHVGDLGYAEGSTARWDAWMALIEPYASLVPVMVSLGNHEYDSVGGDWSKDPSGGGRLSAAQYEWWNGGQDSGGECGVPTARRFRAPQNGNGVFWYSFDVGSVHVAMVSSEHDPSPGAPMGDWLVADLAGVDRAATPWVVLGIHRPLYETEAYPGDYAVAAGLRGLMEGYLLAYGVDVVLAGHYHSFQRTCRLSNMTCVPDASAPGIVHYTTGAAGASLDATTLYPSSYVERTVLGQYGYSVVHAPNATALRLTFFLNADNSVGDDVWLYK